MCKSILVSKKIASADQFYLTPTVHVEQDVYKAKNFIFSCLFFSIGYYSFIFSSYFSFISPSIDSFLLSHNSEELCIKSQ